MGTSKTKLFLFFSGACLLAALLFVAYVALALNWSYSNGERAGFLQKLSSKGWVCKTWEGELSLVAIPGASPEKFLFTVRKTEVVGQLNALMGKRVALDYEQHKGLPSSCWGETEYFVTGVREAGFWAAGTAQIVETVLEKDLGQPVYVVVRAGDGHSAIASPAPNGQTAGVAAIEIEIGMSRWRGLTELTCTSYTPVSSVNADSAAIQCRADST